MVSGEKEEDQWKNAMLTRPCSWMLQGTPGDGLVTKVSVISSSVLWNKPLSLQTMGMAGVLDEIINYVQSLQNQVEVSHLSLLKLSSFFAIDRHNLDI